VGRGGGGCNATVCGLELNSSSRIGFVLSFRSPKRITPKYGRIIGGGRSGTVTSGFGSPGRRRHPFRRNSRTCVAWKAIVPGY